ncbi:MULTISPECIES: ABC transporter permease [Clostridium]|uniref:Dipeptide transport system permease protein DppB n=2 Tax=Clostridium TaxID=1485 RepID=A0A151ARD0_9CLOT|nr:MULTISPECIES: ABC transporter permease [Clostridium]KYH30204.1 dipeptide transport system permease protein DppB [Clostridium colicanis DSM 13634]MBE6044566.1 ABC transporter permease [Clostridium thermopalmarium]PRR76701.1 Dipeptide transport system permease protein DppB [Clostridium thermopalmarium DSM 5974]PVZ23036.1 oligopeptide transport system permease protein [Clostridium thermopalmarium DSM 5974]
MLKYIFKRICYAIITLWVIATLTFGLMKALPGDPFHNPKMSPAVKEALTHKYGLDKPVIEQYGIYMRNLLKGDLGTSIKYPGRSVNQIIAEGFPKSFAIGWRAMVFAVVFGLIFGIIAALNHEKILDYFVIFIAIIGVSVPSIVMGPFLAYTFGVNLGWLPVTVDNSQISLLLPSLTLGLGTLAFISRLMRTTTLEVLGQDYIQTAKAKGLNKTQIVWKHVIRNAIMPVVTVLGPLFAGIITGSIVIEQVFAVAGLGGSFVSSILEQDYSMIMGITIFYAVLIILSVLVVDIAYGFIDPRLRISGKGGK